jgi:CHAT domain-containing protein/tetratricopeptide (TPR) repeat protein
VLLLAALAISTRPLEVYRPAKSPEDLVAIYGSPDAAKMVLRARDAYRNHRFEQASRLSEQGYQDALRRHHPRAQVWFLIGLAGSNYATYNYRQALDCYLNARDTALKNGLYPQAAIALTSLASLYLHVADTTSALAAIEEANRYLPPGEDSPRRNQVLTVFAHVLSMRGDTRGAAALFEQVIESAARRGQVREEALAWHEMGWEWLRSGSLDRAEVALNRAFRLRLFNRDPGLFVTEHHLARLYLAKGDPALARYAIDAAFSWPHHDRTELPEYWLFLTRAEVLEAQGDISGSLADYLRAITSLDEWRARGLPADSFRIGTDIFVHQIYNGAIDAAVRMYQRGGDRRYTELAWELDERIRAGSLREQLKRGQNWTARVPDEYWNTLDRLREFDADQFAAADSGRPALSNEAAHLRMHLAEMEARASAQTRPNDDVPANAGIGHAHRRTVTDVTSPENFFPSNSLTHVRKVLGKSRTLISFHLGEKVSYRWLITGSRFEMKLLPGRAELRRDVQALRSALLSDPRAAILPSLKVYKDLFSDIGGSGNGTLWCLALDRDLFELPIAALVSGDRDNRPAYLIETRALEVVPGAWAIGAPGREAPPKGFLGIGDGIYNAADSRLRVSTPAPASWTARIAGLFRKRPARLELPRLVGSRRELESCARLAGGPVKILTGTSATRRELISALAAKPGVIHIAAHFLTSRTEDRTTAIALGFRQDAAGDARLDILTPDDIASLRVPGSVVVMSGCSSAAGRIVPVAGLLGLARAWMAAGASAVVATQWPTPDDTGELFASFYGHLRDSDRADTVAPAEALRRAQVDMLRSGGARAEPGYWAAYEILGRSN